MIQSALRVSYTSPKVIHWITELILWLFNKDDDQNPKLTDIAESIAAQAIQESFLNGGNYKLGVQTPHIVFNFLDYLLWKNNKKNMKILNLSSAILWSTGIHKIHLTILLIPGIYIFIPHK